MRTVTLINFFGQCPKIFLPFRFPLSGGPPIVTGQAFRLLLFNLQFELTIQSKQRKAIAPRGSGR